MSRSFFAMGSFVTSIIERPRHFYALNTPTFTTSSTPKIPKSLGAAGVEAALGFGLGNFGVSATNLVSTGWNFYSSESVRQANGSDGEILRAVVVRTMLPSSRCLLVAYCVAAAHHQEWIRDSDNVVVLA